MEKVIKRFDTNELKMAQALLLLVVYYPDCPPLKSFTNIAFPDRKDFITVFDDDTCIFIDIENCSLEQQQFFQQKIQEVPEFSGSIFVIENDITRLLIAPAE